MRVMAMLLLAAIPAACRPPAPGADEPPVETVHEGPVASLVPEWQELDPAWVDEASVILVGRLHEYSYPCRFDEFGNSEMILARSWEIVKVLRGEVGAPSFNCSAIFDEEAHVPEEFVEGRDYLLLLAPSEATLKLLADPDTVWGLGNEPSRDEVIAIVDLSQSREEAEALKVMASMSGEHDGFSFTPERWKALREAEENDLPLQVQFLGFITKVVLEKGTTLAAVRSWLGEPDWWWINEGGFYYRYHLHAKTRSAPEEGMISIRLEVLFDPGMGIAGYRTENVICTGADETGDAWRDLTEEEKDEHGLVDLDVSFH